MPTYNTDARDTGTTPGDPVNRRFEKPRRQAQRRQTPTEHAERTFPACALLTGAGPLMAGQAPETVTRSSSNPSHYSTVGRHPVKKSLYIVVRGGSQYNIWVDERLPKSGPRPGRPTQTEAPHPWRSLLTDLGGVSRLGRGDVSQALQRLDLPEMYGGSAVGTADRSPLRQVSCPAGIHPQSHYGLFSRRPLREAQ